MIIRRRDPEIPLIWWRNTSHERCQRTEGIIGPLPWWQIYFSSQAVTCFQTGHQQYTQIVISWRIISIFLLFSVIWSRIYFDGPRTTLHLGSVNIFCCQRGYFLLKKIYLTLLPWSRPTMMDIFVLILVFLRATVVDCVSSVVYLVIFIRWVLSFICCSFSPHNSEVICGD